MEEQQNKMVSTSSWRLSCLNQSVYYYFKPRAFRVTIGVYIIEFQKFSIPDQIVCVWFVLCKDDNIH